jgi:hypothetical protein
VPHVLLEQVVVRAEPFGHGEGEGQERDERENRDVRQRRGVERAAVPDEPAVHEDQDARDAQQHDAQRGQPGDLGAPQLVAEETPRARAQVVPRAAFGTHAAAFLVHARRA